MKEDQILLAMIEDKMEQCGDNYMVTNSAFLDMRQRHLAESLCKKNKSVTTIFCGGYDDAERTIAVFLPDYMEAKGEIELRKYWEQNQEENPLTLIRITQTSYKELSHGDYLGSLTGLGLKREMIGDILVCEKGADIIVLKEMAPFLLSHYEKAGRVSLSLEQLPLEEIFVPEGRFQEKKDTVASLRLDNVVASAFSISRGKATEAIKGGIVFVNGRSDDKPDHLVKEGDKLVLRGKGKAILKTVSGLTKKDRIFIVIDKYV